MAPEDGTTLALRRGFKHDEQTAEHVGGFFLLERPAVSWSARQTSVNTGGRGFM